MGWRVVVVTNPSKLDYSMGYLAVRDVEKTTRVHLDEISVLIVENTASSVTAALLSQLTERKIKVIFCDEKRNPSSELVSYYGCHDCSQKLKTQISWADDAKKLVWTSIVAEKIKNQALLLNELEFNDETNREGHAAKVYFNALFGKSFSRNDDVPVNAALNYGYSLILSCVNREIVCGGYLTQLGIFHDNMFNPFNLGCDLMEPFRPIVDFCVKSMMPKEFGREQKSTLIGLLNKEFVVDGKANTLMNVIKLYVKSVFAAIEQNDASLVKLAEVKYEL